MEIKLCPFCGSSNASAQPENVIDDIEIQEYGDSDMFYAVKCEECGVSGGYASTTDSAIALWNKRSSHGVNVQQVGAKTYTIREN